MRIQHNIAALNSYRQLGNNNNSVAKNLEKLSSGYRINRAGDDAAGLAISEKMRAQITGLATAQKNANDGISLIQTAEGALTEVHSMLNRMVELADQSANGTYQDEVDRENLQAELQSLKSEVDRIADGTNFNGINLLDGSLSSKQVSGSNKGGDYVMLDAGSNKITVTKDQQLQAATKGTYKLNTTTMTGDIGTAGSGFTFEAHYIDEAGAEQTKTITLELDTSRNSAQKVNEAIAKALEGVGLQNGTGATGEAATSDATNLSVQAKTAGSTGTQLIGITLKEYGIDADGKNGTTVTNPSETKVADADAIVGRDADKSNKISFADNFKIGDTITIGDKTYEIADPSGINNVKDGNVAIAAGLNSAGKIDQTSTMKNLVNGLVANGVDAKFDTSDVTGKTITLKDMGQISINKPSIATEVKSDAITAGDAKATKGTWEVLAGAGTAAATQLTIKYMDADGKEKTKTLEYTGDTGAADNATAIKNAINNDAELSKLFKAETVSGPGASSSGANLDIVRLTAIDAGADAPKLLSVKSNDAATTAISGPVREIAQGMDAGKGFVIGKNVKAGDTVSVAGKNFEFVKEGDINKVGEGNIAVVIGKDEKDTASNFNEALKSQGFTTSYLENTNAVRVVENEFSLDGGNASDKVGGLQLQIGDTGDDFNQLRVQVSDMHAKALGLNAVSVATQTDAKNSVEVIKSAINQVSSTRGTLGALQNRLEHTINNLAVTEENMTAAESRIRDVDMAKEMMNYTKNNILVQASQAMLAQANQIPQGVLQLLQ